MASTGWVLSPLGAAERLKQLHQAWGGDGPGGQRRRGNGLPNVDILDILKILAGLAIIELSSLYTHRGVQLIVGYARE
ncbi:hypothetical protein CCMA1212_006040 [Trichoderma ghanense]|uniref:Uncharacterized protein n=1 Tax=Trichoderma ghanense TaxID=65468 RepID=A0ABY2H1Z6_9HYPO